MPSVILFHCVRWEHEKYHNEIERENNRRIKKASRKRQKNFIGLHKKNFGGINTMPLKVVELVEQISKLLAELKEIVETTPLDIELVK